MSAQFAYLETQVLTASPPKLRLLLIQAALRTAKKGLQSWVVPLPEEVSHGLTQLRQILTLLLTSLNERESESKHNLQRVYLYLFQAVTEAQLSGEAKKIRDVVKVLEVENNTWQVLAERYAFRGVDNQTPQSSHNRQKHAPNSPPCMVGDQKFKTSSPAAGLCLVA